MPVNECKRYHKKKKNGVVETLYKPITKNTTEKCLYELTHKMNEMETRFQSLFSAETGERSREMEELREKMVDLREETANLSSTLDGYEVELGEKIAKIKKTMEENSSRTGEVFSLLKGYEEKHRGMERSLSLYTSLHKQVVEVQGRWKEVDSKMVRMEGEHRKEWKKSVEAVETACRSYRENVDRVIGRIEETEKQVEVMRKERQVYLNDIMRLKKVDEEFQREWKEQEKLWKGHNVFREKMERKVDEWDKKWSDVSGKILELRKDLDMLSREVNSLKTKDLSSFLIELKELKEKIGEQDKILESRCRPIQEKITLMEDSVKDIKGMKEMLRKSAMEAEQRTRKHDMNIRNVQMKQEAMEKQVTLLGNKEKELDVEGLKTVVSSLKNNNRMLEETVKDHGKKVDGLERKHIGFESLVKEQGIKYSTLENKQTTLEEGIHSLENKHNILDGSVKKYGEKVDGVEKKQTSLETSLKVQGEKVGGIEKGLSSLEKKQSGLETSFKDQGNKYSILENKHSGLETSVKQYGEKVDGIERKQLTLETSLKDQGEKVDGVEKGLSSLENKETSLETSLKQYGEKVDGIERKQSTLESSVKQQRDKVDGIERKYSTLETSLKDQGTKQSILEKSVKGMETSLKQQGIKYNGLERKHSGLEKMVKEQGTKYSTLENSFQGIETSIKQQQEEISSNVERKQSELEKSVKQQGEKVGGVERKYLSLEKGISSLENKQLTLETSLKQQGNKVDGVERKHLGLENSLKQYGEKMDGLEKMVKDQGSKQSQWEGVIKGMESSLKQQGEKSNQEITSLTSHYTHLEKGLSSLETKHSTLEQDLKKEQHKYSILETNQSNIQQQFTTLQKNHSTAFQELKNHHTTIDRTINALTTDQTTTKNHTTALRVAHKTLENTLQQVEHRAKDNQTKHSMLEKSIASLETEHKKMNTQLKNIDLRQNTAVKRVELKLNTTSRSFENKFSTLEQRIQTHEQEVKEYIETQLPNLKEELQEMYASYFKEINDKIQQLEVSNHSLLDQIEVVKSKQQEPIVLPPPLIEETPVSEHSTNLQPILEDIDIIKALVSKLETQVGENHTEINKEIKSIKREHSSSGNTGELITLMGNKIQAVTKEMHALKKMCGKEGDIRETVDQLNTLLHECENTLKKEIDTIHEKVSTLNSILHQHHSFYEDVSGSLVTMDHTLHTLKEGTETNLQHIHEIRTTMKEHYDERTQLLEEKIADLYTQMEEGNTSRKTLMEDIQQNHSFLEQYKNEMKDTHSSLEKDVFTLKSVMEEERVKIQKMMGNITDYLDHKTTIQSLLDEMKTQITQLKEEQTHGNENDKREKDDNDKENSSEYRQFWDKVQGSIEELRQDMNLELLTVKNYVRKLNGEIQEYVTKECTRMEQTLQMVEKAGDVDTGETHVGEIHTEIKNEINTIKEGFDASMTQIQGVMTRLNTLEETKGGTEETLEGIQSLIQQHYTELKAMTEKKVDLHQWKDIQSHLSSLVDKYKEDIQDELGQKVDTKEMETQLSSIHTKINDVRQLSETIEGKIETIHETLRKGHLENADRNDHSFKQFQMVMNEFKETITSKYSLLSENYLSLTKEIVDIQSSYKEKLESSREEILDMVSEKYKNQSSLLEHVRKLFDKSEEKNQGMKKQLHEFMLKLEMYENTKKEVDEDLSRRIDQLREDCEGWKKEDPKKYRFIENEMNRLKGDITKINHSLQIDIPRTIKEMMKEEQMVLGGTTSKKKNKFNLLFRKNKSVESSSPSSSVTGGAREDSGRLSFSDMNMMTPVAVGEGTWISKEQHGDEIKQLHSLIHSLKEEIRTLKKEKPLDREQVMFMIRYNIEKNMKKMGVEGVVDTTNLSFPPSRSLSTQSQGTPSPRSLGVGGSGGENKGKEMGSMGMEEKEWYRQLEEKNHILEKEIEVMKAEFKNLNRTVNLLKLN